MRARVHRHVLSQLLCLGRHTVTGVLGTSGRLFCDWTADYRMYSAQRVESRKLFIPVRRALTDRLGAAEPLVVALDDTRLRKSGSKTHGVKYTRDPLGPPFNVNFIKAQRFLQISMASTAGNGMARMVPIDLVHAPAPTKPRPDADEESRAQFRQSQREMSLPKIGADRLHLLREAMDEDGQQDRPLWSVVDGGYTNRTFFKNLPSRTEAIGRIRADAKLYYLPESTEGRPGRNRVYGEKAPTPEALRKDSSIPWQEVEVFAAGKNHRFKIKTLGPLRWRPAGIEHDLRLIVIAPLAYRPTKHCRVLYRRPAYLICTDPSASIQELLQAYVWRWDIEVNFRDEKNPAGRRTGPGPTQALCGKRAGTCGRRLFDASDRCNPGIWTNRQTRRLANPEMATKEHPARVYPVPHSTPPTRSMGTIHPFLRLRFTTPLKLEAPETRSTTRKRPVLCGRLNSRGPNYRGRRDAGPTMDLSPL